MKTWGKIGKDLGRMHGFFDDPVEVTEKMDGSQINFGKIDGELWIKSRRQLIDLDNPPQLFNKAIATIKNLHLVDRYSYHGEAITSPKHNTLEYGGTPSGYITLFGILDPDYTPLPHYIVKEIANIFGLDCVPLIYTGIIQDFEHLVSLMPMESYLGGPAEGLVCKNFLKPCQIPGQEFPMTQFKYVTDAFKEKHTGNKNFKPNKDVVKEIGEAICTEARWTKAIQRLRDEDKLSNSPKDIGPLIKEIVQDVRTEEEEWIKDQLFAHFWKGFGAACIKGFPEWYKEKLAREMFEND